MESNEQDNCHSHHSMMYGKEVKQALALVLILLAIFLAVKTYAEFKGLRFIGGGVPVSNTIAVSGEGEVFAVPDIANFAFSVVEERPTADAAQEAAAEKINKAIDFLKDNGIDEDDIKTTGYNLYPKYEYKIVPVPLSESSDSVRYSRKRERVLRGFEINQTISVKVRDTKITGVLLSGIGEIGVKNVSGISFTIDDEDALKEEARELAIDEARTKAKSLAKDLDVSLVRIVNFSENGSPYYRQYGYDNYDAGFESSVGGSAAPDIPVGENRIVSNVTITYEIR